MAQMIFGIFVLCIFIYYPQTIIVTGLLLAGFYFYGKYEVVERDKTVADEVDDEPTMEEKAEKEVESKLKKGFEDDPKWQAASKKVNDQAGTMREISDVEMKIEDLEKELEEECDPFTANLLEEARKRLKTLENRAGITQKRVERAKEKVEPPPEPQAAPRDMTDQEIDAALQELNDL